MTDPFFTVIMPTYNRAKYIKKALNSVLNQTFKSWEIIIVDNNSTDKTEEIVTNFKDKRIKFYRISNNGVIAVSRNYGIIKSSGKYLAFLDSDDWWRSSKLELCYNEILKGKKFVYHNVKIVRRKNQFFLKNIAFFRSLNNPVYNDFIENGPAFASSSVVVEKELFKKIKYFNEDIPSNWDDFDAWIRLSKLNTEFHVINHALGYNWVGQDSGLTPEVQIEMIFSFKKKYIDNSKTEKDYLPQWCVYALIVSNFRIKDYKNSLFFLKKIKFSKLSLFKKAKLLVLILIIYSKKILN